MTDADDTAPILAGDLTDDDGQVLDSLVQQAPEPPSPKEQPKAPLQPLAKTRTKTRLLTQTLRLSPTMGAVQLLVADEDRKSITLSTHVEGAGTTVVRVGDDQSKVFADMGAYLIYPNTTDDTAFAGHNGPLYVSASDTDPNAVVTVSVAVVSE